MTDRPKTSQWSAQALYDELMELGGAQALREPSRDEEARAKFVFAELELLYADREAQEAELERLRKAANDTSLVGLLQLIENSKGRGRAGTIFSGESRDRVYRAIVHLREMAQGIKPQETANRELEGLRELRRIVEQDECSVTYCANGAGGMVQAHLKKLRDGFPESQPKEASGPRLLSAGSVRWDTVHARWSDTWAAVCGQENVNQIEEPFDRDSVWSCKRCLAALARQEASEGQEDDRG